MTHNPYLVSVSVQFVLKVPVPNSWDLERQTLGQLACSGIGSYLGLIWICSETWTWA